MCGCFHSCAEMVNFACNVAYNTVNFIVFDFFFNDLLFGIRTQSRMKAEYIDQLDDK
jgi:hypothetical protein